jgi:hypothetical protein
MTLREKLNLISSTHERKAKILKGLEDSAELGKYECSVLIHYNEKDEIMKWLAQEELDFTITETKMGFSEFLISWKEK